MPRTRKSFPWHYTELSQKYFRKKTDVESANEELMREITEKNKWY